MMKKVLVLLICFILTACSHHPISDNRTIPLDNTSPEEKRVSFYGVGDNLIHNCIYWQADKNLPGPDFDFKPMYKLVADDIKNADISYINQETILGGTELTLSSYPLFNSPKELGRDMIELGFDVFSHATNHVFDKGEAGVENTCNFYMDKDVIFTGIYKKGEDNIKISEKNGIKIAYLNYTYVTNGLSLSKNSNFYVPIASTDKIIDDIKRAKSQSDFVVMFAHWGEENQLTPNERQKTDAEIFAKSGCDVIIGTHPHSVQPVEMIDNTLVVYSLGNFISAQKGHKNLIGGTINFDFVIKDDIKAIENVKYNYLVTQYEAGFSDIRIIPFDEYTPELANKHGAGITYEYIETLIKNNKIL